MSARGDVSAIPLSDWRTFALTTLESYGLKVVNPLELAWTQDSDTQSDEPSDSADLRVRRALDLIDQCDAMLANLEKSSYATAMEIFYGYRRGKIVTVVGPSPYSPWVLSHSQARFNDVERALEYIIEEHPLAAPLSWAMQYEANLSDRYERMPPCGEPDYKFVGGNLPVLVIAPHATAYWREGEFYEQDSFTGALSAVLNRMTGCHAMLSHYCCVADPLWYLETPFRRAMTDVIKSGQVGLVVILLGSSWHEAPGLQVACYGRKEETLKTYMKQLQDKLDQLEPVTPSSYDKRVRPLATFVSDELDTPVVAIRMHKRYRMPRLQAQQFSALASLLSEFVLDSGLELARSRK